MTMQIDAALLRSVLGGPDFSPPHPGPWLERIRPAAVVVPIRLEPEPSVSFVLRAAHLSEHAGEVGFPGGKPEPGEALIDTALRETHEEVGLARSELELLGTLTPVPVITGLHLIHPFVMALAPGAELSVASEEVERTLQTPVIDWISGKRRRQAFPVEWQGSRLLMPEFELDGATLYGASALVFQELVTRVADGLRLDLPEPELVDTPAWERQR